ncbi:MAG: hypothetical protein WBB48_10355 [Thermodesulfobacteriota bacterium]
MNQEVLLADGSCLDINDLVVDACAFVDCGPDGMCQDGQCCAFEVSGSCITTPSAALLHVKHLTTLYALRVPVNQNFSVVMNLQL